MSRDRELVFGTLREDALRDVVALLHDGPADDKPDVHGFRATLRTWLAEQTDCPEVVAEAVLAHFKGGVVGAYQRRQSVCEGFNLSLCIKRQFGSARLPFNATSR